jgi:hypothetical protein
MMAAICTYIHIDKIIPKYYLTLINCCNIFQKCAFTQFMIVIN